VILFHEDFRGLELRKPLKNQAPSYLARRKHLVVGEYMLAPDYSVLMEDCIKTLDHNGVTVIWD
jgi:hypothetical protein